MFEDEINFLSEPYLTANGGEPYPLYPNEAGMALINLWRKEWRSNDIFEVSSNPSGSNSIRQRLFTGQYTVNLRSGKSGQLIESRNVSISNKHCIQMKHQDNVITDGDFDGDELSSEWHINGDHQLHWDGYLRNGLFLKNHSITKLDISHKLIEGKLYRFKMYVKAVSTLLKNQRIIVQYFNPRLLEGVTIAEATFKNKNEWVHVDSLTSFEAEENNIFIITSEFNGDIIIDHASERFS